VFAVLLNSKLPPSELSKERLQHEAVSIIGAGFDTTRQMLTMIAFHIIHNPHVYQRLRTELAEAIPDPTKMLSWAQLQQLPYLTACIEEGLTSLRTVTY
jgi:cytochrome P450